jgi:hypothetical protein
MGDKGSETYSGPRILQERIEVRREKAKEEMGYAKKLKHSP